MYRELIQNSNDADAKNVEIHFTTTPISASSTQRVVSQVVFRNDGFPFRPADWSRLRNIAEGNPDVSKVGAFGVGFYSVFSVCDEPLVASGEKALAFIWRGDTLWARSTFVENPDKVWTSFVLRSREKYPVPDLVEFAQFLCTSLTFTSVLHTIRLYIDSSNVLTIKKVTEAPRPVIPPRSSSWWSNDGMITHSPNSVFKLGHANDTILESFIDISVQLRDESHSIRARYMSARADVHVTSDMQRRVERVTKKMLPHQVTVHVFIDATSRSFPEKNKAAEVLKVFSPQRGIGRVFIGFRTSQTTGFAAHLAAPLVPTVEREAIDLQEPTLEIFNSDLLAMSGTLMRLCFEQGMACVASRWESSEQEREILREKSAAELAVKGCKMAQAQLKDNTEGPQHPIHDETGFSFMRFVSGSVRKLAGVMAMPLSSVLDEGDLLNPLDALPLCVEEQDAILLMRAFSPETSTPDKVVGTLIANSFVSCMPSRPPSVLTRTGVALASDCRLPFCGIETFVKNNVVRKIVVDNAATFLRNVAGCRPLNLSDMISELQSRPLSECEFIRFVRWWVKFVYANREIPSGTLQLLYNSVSLLMDGTSNAGREGSKSTIYLKDMKYFCGRDFDTSLLPMPSSVMPPSIQDGISERVLRDDVLSDWFEPVPFMIWAAFIANHRSVTEGLSVDHDVRLHILARLSKEHIRLSTDKRVQYERWLHRTFGKKRCIPVEFAGSDEFVTEFPTDVYLSDAEISIFQGLGHFRKVARSLESSGVSEAFLMVLGVRKAISIEFLLTQLSNLKWSDNPQPLVKYLRSVSLSKGDLEKLQTYQYLPAANENSRTYSPEELLLPNEDLLAFPNLKILQWPSSTPLHPRCPDAEFLKKLGCKVDPPLKSVLDYIVEEIGIEENDKLCKCLGFLAKRLGSGSYGSDYGAAMSVKFLPAITKNPLSNNEPKKAFESPQKCFSRADSLCMGFPVFDPALNRKSNENFGERFCCSENPTPQDLVKHLQDISSKARNMTCGTSTTPEELCFVLNTFRAMFKYLSSQTQRFNVEHFRTLRNVPFIPCQDGSSLNWYCPSQVYFKRPDDDMCELLYDVVDFDPFLASAGVQSEPSSADLLNLVVQSPEEVLLKLGSANRYLILLRRIAVTFTSRTITSTMRQSSFFLGFYSNPTDHINKANSPNEAINETSQRSQCCLARAEEISIVDNSLFTRKFRVLVAPQESDLERFYERCGSVPISKRVSQRYEVFGNPKMDTALSIRLISRITERGPLLTVPSDSSKTLRSNAESILSPENLTVLQVDAISVKLTLGSTIQRQDVSCCAKPEGKSKHNIYITSNLDYFDVGNAIGGLIFQKSHIESSFFIASLLEAPLEQLRARGFPVDRIIKSPELNDSNPIHPTYELPATEKHNSGEEAGSIGDSAKSGKPDDSRTGFEEILRSMFPDCSREHIQKMLGSNPNQERLRTVANTLANDNYPRENSHQTDSKQDETKETDKLSNEGNKYDRDNKHKRSGLGGVSSFFKRHRTKQQNSTQNQGNEINEGNGAPSPPETGSNHARPGVAMAVDPNRTHAPEDDSHSYHYVEDLLRNAANSSHPVPSSRVLGSEGGRTRTPPEGINNIAHACSPTKFHDLKPIRGPTRNGKTANGTLAFSSEREPASEEFLYQNWEAVEKFSVVLRNLSSVFEIRFDSVAIMHEGTGGTIAFNQRGALYFNVRFFHALHYREHLSTNHGCYAFWFTTFAHELAHNICGDHGQTHGFITERYVELNLPKLIVALPNFAAIKD